MSLPITTIPSPNFTRGRARNVRLVVIHTVEAPERGTIAEDVARNWFATPAARSSAHYVVDNDSIVRCVDEADTAWAAPGANADGLQIEHAGYAAQTPSQWGDDYSRAMLELSARLTADLCRRYAVALQTHGFAAPTIATQATATGLWQIALAAGLVVAPAPSSSHPFTAGSLAA